MTQDDFKEFDDLLDTGKPTRLVPVSDSDKQIEQIDLRAAATQRLNDILDRSALSAVSKADSSRLYELAPDLMIYDLPVAAKPSTPSVEPCRLSPDEYLYLFLTDNDFPPSTACKIMSIPRSRPRIWQKTNSLFADAYKTILEAYADDAEMRVAHEAVTNPKANIERMFFVKAHKPMYRDNAPTPAPANIQVNVTVDSKDFDVSVGLKDAGSDDDLSDQ